MNDNLNKQELNRLAQIGSADAGGTVSPSSIGTSIAASVAFCTPTVISAVTTISLLSVGVSTLFSCGKC